MAKSVQQVVQKYQSRVAGAGSEYAAGVNNPKRDWLTAYANAQNRMAAGLQAAIAAGKPLKKAQASGGTQNWQTKAAQKGARNYASSATDAANGYSQVADKILAAGDAARAAASAMPDTTIEQRLQRALAAMKATSQYWNK